MEEKITLTKRQRQIVDDLQNGSRLFCDSEFKGAWVSDIDKSHEDYHINNGVFFRLVDKDIIYQEANYPFNYILTELGKKI